ncbi:MAG TPA: hypothetical protein VGA72_12405 [Anaerolineales bacterium]
MKKAAILGLIVALALGGCVLPAIPTANTGSTPNAGPTVDVAGTVDAILKTALAQTLTAQPTVTPVPPTDTPTPVLESFVPVTVEASTFTATPITDLTTTPATATSGPADATFTATLAAASPATSIPTLTIRLWGTLPPAVPSSDIILINKSKAQAYISLQVTSPDGRYAVIEYPVVGRIEIKAPLGSYLYVAWVGGNKMVGNFKLQGHEELSITLYKDKIDVH